MHREIEEKIEGFKKDLDAALRALWRMRAKAREKSKEKTGRGEATAGKHMDPLSALLKQFIVDAGLKDAQFFEDRRAALPGYFRPLKTWDLVVKYGDALAIAIELKSQIGSYGNNFNNRIEEALGSAVDLHYSYTEGSLQSHLVKNQSRALPPFRGWLMVFPYVEETIAPKKIPYTPLFPIDDAFLVKEKNKRPQLTAYEARYREFVQRVMAQRLYDAAAIVFTAPEEGYLSDYNLDNFLSLLAHHAYLVTKSG